MTITLYLKKETILDDLKILAQIFNAQKPEFVEPLSKFLRPLNVSMNKADLMLSGQIEIHVTSEEFALICIFNKGSFLL